MRGPLPPTLIALTFATGMVDATAFLGLGGVFVGNMTGNVVFFGVALTGAGLAKTEATVVALLAFAVGAALAGQLRLLRSSKAVLVMRRMLVVEIAFVAAATIAALLLGVDSDRDRLIVVAILAIALGLQNATVHALAIPDLTTTVVTQQLSGIGAEALNVEAARDRLARRTAALAAMLAGAIVAALLIRSSVELALAVALGALFVSAAVFLVSSRFSAAAPADRTEPPAR
jgi:uncharacterized membrane protein YoaK (UPF0700 family)